MLHFSKILVHLLLFTLLAPSVAQNRAATYDVVILGGRVMDPESGLDAVRNVGISGGSIRAITTVPIRGTRVLHAEGLVVAPGFIDLLAHGQDLENNRLQAMDGVTTALELESGTGDVDRWYAERAGKRMLNYGATVGHGAIRKKVMPNGDDADRRAGTDEEIARIKLGIDDGLRRGALGIGMGLEYAPAVSRWEVLEVFRAAAKYGATCHVHIRFGTVQEPGSATEAVEEMIAGSAITGAPVEIVHISSMGLRSTPHLLRMIGDAHEHGVDVTTECYPYTAFGTGIASAVFDPGWQQRFRIDYGDLQWAATGERLTAESFARYQKTGGMVIAHAIPETVVRDAVASPLTVIGSDGGLQKGKGHPRGAGTYSRVLGRYVREQKALTLMQALRKMTIMPARRMEHRAPIMRNKGRIRAGADADIVVFDPARVIDRATYDEPAIPSVGFRYVLVNGVPVVSEGKLVEGVFPGRPVRAAVITPPASK